MPHRLTLAIIAVICPAAAAQVLHERGPVASIPGGHTSGADLFQAPEAGAGVGLHIGHDFETYLAQRFEADEAWVIDRITLWAHQNGSTLAPTIDGLHLEIWDGPPNVPTSAPVAGDLSANVLDEASFSGVYAAFYGLAGRTDRPIMELTASDLGWELEAGTYWLVWGATGSLPGGPYATYLATPAGPVAGEALQGRFGAWGPARVDPSGEQLAFPVRIEGDSACPADCDGVSGLDLFDFLCFLNQYAAGDPKADCDASGVIDPADFACYQGLFAAGCP
ncbi:MAG: GC-type dockerin domain-anchored protein [Phycisphaerales bacterium JB039]